MEVQPHKVTSLSLKNMSVTLIFFSVLLFLAITEEKSQLCRLFSSLSCH